mgnify:CR=1 FL=1
MRKINLIFLGDISETEWKNGETKVSLKRRDEAEKEIGEVLVDNEAIIYKLKNVEDDMYSIKRYLSSILKNDKIERNIEKIYIDGKLFGERKEKECFVYCETENEIEFLNFVNSFNDISLTFSNSSKSFNVKFSINESIPTYIKLADKFFMEKKYREETIDTENGMKYVRGNELEVEVNDIVTASSVLKWLSNYKYDNIKMSAMLLRKSIIKKLPKNNLTDNCNELWSIFKGFETDIKMTPELIYVLSNFNYSPSMNFDDALKTISEAMENKRIGSFEIETEKGIISFNPFEDPKLVLKSENGTKINSAIEDFHKISEYVKEFELEYYNKPKDNYISRTQMNINILSHENEISITKRTFAKTDFKYLHELSEKKGKEIKFEILHSYDNFKIDNKTLKIKVPSYYSDERIKEYKNRFSEAFQYFENIETYSN